MIKRWLKRFLIPFLVGVGGLIAGVVLAFVIQELTVQVTIKEPIKIIDSQTNQTVVSPVSLTLDPGVPQSYEFVVENSSNQVNYQMTYKASVSEGSWSDLELRLELDPDGPAGGCNYSISAVNVKDGSRQRSVSLSQDLITTTKHCLRLTIKPLENAQPGQRIVKLEFQRGAS